MQPSARQPPAEVRKGDFLMRGGYPKGSEGLH